MRSSMNPNSSKPETKYRKDYTPPSHLIDNIDLYIELGETITHVTSQMQMRMNPETEKTDALILNGADQTLQSVKLNNELLKTNQYVLDSEHLTLKNLPDSFTLEIKSDIKPQKNTSLMGLYKSNDLFCTQCEAEGFRKITYFLDRPDVLSHFTTTITADKKRYPILLSNGNLIDSGNLSDGLHWMKWEDPFLKPCYLFAMVAGDLDYIEDYYETQSHRKITLRIFALKKDIDQCQYAMSSLKKAMQWDEEKFGLACDLDTFMIVAMPDFNMGAMENKGLNIFNTKYVFAKPNTATDLNYRNIDSVVGHEYFHNWTGNRVTCRDWFQISLKEGLTRFRDQIFSEDIGSKAVDRICEAQSFRTIQFSEDAGPLAHPIRPESYVEINNFYTATVYEKGAEVIRMIYTLLGQENFRKGMDLYFERHDGCAVTCDDFVQAMEDASNIDLSQFRLWYSQAGTPELSVSDRYDAEKKCYTLTVKQYCPPTPNQPEKLPMFIPLSIGLLNPKSNNEISQTLHIKQEKETFTFDNIPHKPIPSLLRNFSAPIKLKYDYADKDLAFLMAHDSDPFARWEAGQVYAKKIILGAENSSFTAPSDFISALKAILSDKNTDKHLLAQMLTLPSEIYLGETMDVIDVDAIHHARQFVKKTLAEKLTSDFTSLYEDNASQKPYHYSTKEMGQRALKNTCLDYLMALEDESIYDLCLAQFNQTDNMTDKFAALTYLANTDCPHADEALATFYQDYKNDPLVIDKWFQVQAESNLPDTINRMQVLLNHPDFDIKQPNRVYASLWAFSKNNPTNFHIITGEGYRLLGKQILRLNKINPHVAARLLKTFVNWRRFNTERQNLICEQLDRILNEPNLAKDLYEIASKAL